MNGPVEGRYAGVDVSKERLDVAALRAAGPVERFSVANDPEGIDALVGRLVEADAKLVVLEATGGYERPAAAAIAASGISIAVVNPRQDRQDRRGGPRALRRGRAARAQGAAQRGSPALLGEILDTRRQLLVMLVAENNPLAATVSAQVKRRIHSHLRWLEKELAHIDRELEESIEASPTWRENETLLRTVPGRRTGARPYPSGRASRARNGGERSQDVVGAAD